MWSIVESIKGVFSCNDRYTPATALDLSSSPQERVLQYWFHGDLHFNYKTKWFPDGSAEIQRRADEAVTCLFGDLFCQAIGCELESWKSDNKSTVALIVVLDQFSRHIFRLRQLPTGCAERKMADELALAVAEEFISKPGWDNDLTVPEFVFSMMPFRHNASIDRLKLVMDAITKRQGKETDALELLHKFSKQTVRRLQHLQDRAKVHVQLYDYR